MQFFSECSERERLRRRNRAFLLVDEREFQEVSERAEGVRLLFLVARAKLQRHLEEHGCEVLSASVR